MAQTVAKATYTGQMTSDIRRGPSGTQYTFRNPMGGESRAVEVSNVEDALWLERSGIFEMEWSSYGRLAKRMGGPISSVKQALKDLSYRQKQSIVANLPLDIAGNASEDKMDEALKPVVEDLQQQMENG